MQVPLARRRLGETPIIGLHERRQKCVRRLNAADACQPQLLHQPVLQGVMSPFHAALGLAGLAHRISMLSSDKARPNWVMPSPLAASSLDTRKIECLSE